MLYCALFLWFVAEYLVFERVHLYTYDIFAERLGFKLGWGCFAFYPYFYLIGLWAIAHRPDPGTPEWALVIYAADLLRGLGVHPGRQSAEVLVQDPARAAVSGLHASPRPSATETTPCCAAGSGASPVM